jgi:amidase
MISPFASASQMLAQLRTRQIGCAELLQLHTQRIEALDPQINAVVVRSFEPAQVRAQAADAALQRGESWGPLHGLPITIKESFDFPGTPTTWGFVEHQHHIASQPALAVQRLLDAGAIVMGKTNVPVALSDWQSFNPVYGTTNNPWDLSRSPGGSSGGSAAALASGMSALELGSDIGASIRNPAHYCGVYGHKPTWGMVPKQGHQLPGMHCAESGDISVAGPMARSAKDLQLAMNVLTTPLQQFGPLGWMPAQWRASKPIGQCRVAIVFDDDEANVDHSIQQRLHVLADFLRAQGITVLENKKPVDSTTSHRVYMHLLRAATGAWLHPDVYEKFQALARESDPSQDTMAERVWRGSTLSHRDWVAFDQQRALLRQQWSQFFTDVDLLITPVATTAAVAHNHQGERWERMVQVNGQDQPHTHGLFWAGYPGVVGLPATAIPIGLTPQGLPVGAQIIGDTFADPLCLAMAQWLEDEWLGFTPPPGL